jgi:hypothetical protein
MVTNPATADPAIVARARLRTAVSLTGGPAESLPPKPDQSHRAVVGLDDVDRGPAPEETMRAHELTGVTCPPKNDAYFRTIGTRSNAPFLIGGLSGDGALTPCRQFHDSDTAALAPGLSEHAERLEAPGVPCSL